MKRVWATNEIELRLRANGYQIIAGADEVGRGAIAGPLVTAVVVLPDDWSVPVCDSKMLSKNQRTLLAEQIHASAIGVGIGQVESVDIDQLGLSAGLQEAFIRALEALDVPISRLIMDGNIDFLSDFEIADTVIGGDRLSVSVAAASIVAKVYRDSLMREYGEIYSVYGFDSHVGYGTAKHIQALRQHGYSPIHRRSFQVKL